MQELKDELGRRGYKVVDAETYKYPIDALIFKGNLFEISHISGNNMPMEMRADGRVNYGVLLINALGKSADEIEDMLNTRYYSPLF